MDEKILTYILSDSHRVKRNDCRETKYPLYLGHISETIVIMSYSKFTQASLYYLDCNRAVHSAMAGQ